MSGFRRAADLPARQLAGADVGFDESSGEWWANCHRCMTNLGPFETWADLKSHVGLHLSDPCPYLGGDESA